MITPQEVLLNRQQYVQDHAKSLVTSYSRMLSTQLPDKEGFYHVDAPSSPGFSDQEKEVIHEFLEQEFTNAGWDYERTKLIFSYKLRRSYQE